VGANLGEAIHPLDRSVQPLREGVACGRDVVGIDQVHEHEEVVHRAALVMPAIAQDLGSDLLVKEIPRPAQPAIRLGAGEEPATRVERRDGLHEMIAE